MIHPTNNPPKYSFHIKNVMFLCWFLKHTLSPHNHKYYVICLLTNRSSTQGKAAAPSGRGGICLGFWRVHGPTGLPFIACLPDHIHHVNLTFFSFSHRDLGEHGFLVEGSLIAIKREAESVSIPYKYVVYKNKKDKYEYEYIYKLDSTPHTTNRCLFVKPHLVNEDGKCNLFSCNYICLHVNSIWIL